MKIHEYAAQGRIRSIEKEIAKGVNIDSKDEEYPYTPLAYTVASDDADLNVIRFLIEKGADINARGMGKHQCTVFSFAVRKGNIEKINFLLDLGADINYESTYNSTALVEAVRSHNCNLIEVLNLLIARGCTTNKEKDYIALEIASRKGRFDAVQLLIDRGVDMISLPWTPLMQAIALGTIEDVEALLDEDADLTAKDCEGRTPFLLSLVVGDLEKAQLIFVSGAKINDRGKKGQTGFMYAIAHDASKKRVRLLQWLICIGCNIEERDESSITPLHFAVSCNAINCATILLKHGANPNSRSKYNSL